MIKEGKIFLMAFKNIKTEINNREGCGMDVLRWRLLG